MEHAVIARAFELPGGVTVQPGESPGGIDDLPRVVALARRAKLLGMKVLLDLHYSDWWADPGQQLIPQAWETYSLEQLVTAVHDFTGQAIEAMRAAGAEPDMVQLGNETNDGFLWPIGRASGPNGHDGFARLLSSAARAVREVDPGVGIMLHLANGNDNGLYRSMLSALVARGVDFDVIGLSFYPYWHNSPGKLPMNELAYNLADVSERFNRPVVVVETAYAYTLADADAEKNSFGAPEEAAGGYVASVQGQATFLRDLLETVAGVPNGRGLGAFYWEPDWIPVAGAGWYTRGGDGWDNQALFDAAGKALPSMNVFRAVTQDRPVVIAAPRSVEPVAASTWVGRAPSLPGAVQVIFSDDSIRPTAVRWDEIAADRYAAAGTFTVAGQIPGVALPATAQVTVSVDVNLLVNPGLEAGTEAGWAVADPSDALAAAGTDVRSGAWAFHWYLKSADFRFAVEQTVSGLQAGKTYRFSFWAMGSSGEPMHAYATCGSATTPLDFALAGWKSDPDGWLHESIDGLDGAAGSCTVGVTSDARGGDWGSLDDFSFTEQ